MGMNKSEVDKVDSDKTAVYNQLKKLQYASNPLTQLLPQMQDVLKKLPQADRDEMAQIICSYRKKRRFIFGGNDV